MTSARLYGELKGYELDVVRKRQELDQLLAEDSVDEISELEEVLHVKYMDIEEETQVLLSEDQTLVKTLEADEKRLEAEAAELEKGKQDLSNQIAVWENKVQEFEDQVHALNQSNDEFHWEKHVLIGDYEELHLKEYVRTQEERRDGLKRSIDDLHKKKDELKVKEEGLGEKLHQVDVNKARNELQLNQEKMQLNELIEEEDHLFEGVRVLEVGRDSLYDESFVTDQIEEVLAAKEERINHLIIEKAMTEQMMESLREGRLISLPEQVEVFLDDHDIDYRLGYQWLMEYEGERIGPEVYMDRINVLPYALIMDDSTYSRFQGLTKHYHMNMVLPIVSEGYIRACMSGNGSQVEGMTYHTAFDEGLLDAGNVDREIDELSARLKDIQEEMIRLGTSRGDYQTLLIRYRGFVASHEAQEIDDRKKRFLELEDQLAEAAAEIERIGGWKLECKEAVVALTREIEGLDRSLVDQLEVLSRYSQLAAAFEVIAEVKVGLSGAKKEIGVVAMSIQTNQAEVLRTQDRIRETRQRLIRHKEKIEDAGKQMEGFVLEREVDLVRTVSLFQESLEILLTRYETFSKALGERKSIEEALQVYQGQVKERRFKLDEIGLSEEEFGEVDYDELRYDEVYKRLIELEKAFSDLDGELKHEKGGLGELGRGLVELRNKVLSDHSKEELFDVKELILTDYRERKKENKYEWERLKEDKRLLADVLTEVARGMKEIYDEGQDGLDSLELPTDQVDELVPLYKVDVSRVEVNNAYTKVNRSLRSLIREVERLENEVKNAYMELKQTYSDKNELFQNLFTQLLKKESVVDHDFVMRVMRQTHEAIDRTLEKYETDIRLLGEKEGAIFDMVLSRVYNVYEELKELDQHSIIDLNGRRQKMLYIRLPKKETIDTSRLIAYMKDVLRVAKQRIENHEELELDRYLDNHLKLDQLLDHYIPIGSIGIQLSKIEQNKVSKMTWEEVGKASGGELFVSVFIVFSSLLSYTRGYRLGSKQQGKVLVMDNPFGPVSSEHLLTPLFNIAGTYDTQLICFTHINTSAITSQFDLIYSLRVIQEGGSGREHIQVDVAKNKEDGVEFVDTGKFEIGDGEQIGLL